MIEHPSIPLKSTKTLMKHPPPENNFISYHFERKRSVGNFHFNANLCILFFSDAAAAVSGTVDDAKLRFQ